MKTTASSLAPREDLMKYFGITGTCNITAAAARAHLKCVTKLLYLPINLSAACTHGVPAARILAKRARSNSVKTIPAD